MSLPGAYKIECTYLDGLPPTLEHMKLGNIDIQLIDAVLSKLKVGPANPTRLVWHITLWIISSFKLMDFVLASLQLRLVVTMLIWTMMNL